MTVVVFLAILITGLFSLLVGFITGRISKTNQEIKLNNNSDSLNFQPNKDAKEMPYDLIGDYYRCQLLQATPCENCGNKQIYVGIYQSVDKRGRYFAYCIKCQHNLSFEHWQRETKRNVFEDLEFNQKYSGE